MNITQWAIKHGVSHSALHELESMLHPTNLEQVAKVTTEAGVQNAVRLEASKQRITLWRNNVGALIDDRGVPVRYGLANDSKAMNDTFKSSDLIGIRPVTVTPEHVGQVIGQFVAREVKSPSWTYTGSKHEMAQSNFLKFVRLRGGDAQFVNGIGSF